MSNATPCKKISYFSQDGADKAITRMKDRAKKSKNNKRWKPERAYLCPNCSFWHVTSQKFVR